MNRAMRRTLLTVATVAVVVFSAFPFFWMASTAFKPDSEIFTETPHWLPAAPTLEQFRIALARGGIGRFFLNSAMVAVATTVLSVIVAALAAVAVSRFRFRGRTQLLVMILVVQMVPLEALVIPLFLQVKSLGLLNSILGLMVVYVALSLAFGIWMLRGFVAAVPVELEEAAYIDGASWWRMFRSILLPLVMPGLVATSIFSFITAWNEFIFAMTILGSATDQYTVSIGLKSFFGLHANDWGSIMAASTIITIPVMIFFVIVQRRLSAGMVAGAVKG